jgi:hypothetical protein
MMKLEITGEPNPYWIASTDSTDYPQLNEDTTVDVAIIGGGIVGISSAYMLNQAGLQVAVIEADRILNGTTGHTTAKITSQHGIIYSTLKKQIGRELAMQYAEANQNAIRQIAKTVDEKQIPCDFKWCPAYIYTQSDKYVQDLADESEDAKDLGIKASFLDTVPLPFEVKAALRFDEQAQFHPLKYLKALARECSDKGALIFENTEALDIDQAGHGCSKEEIRDRISKDYYPLDFSIEQIRPTYQFNAICQESVPQAITAFLESASFEDAIRTAISLGGDSDTIGAITGSIAEAYYGVPEEIGHKALSYLDPELRSVYDQWVEFTGRDGFGI